MKKSDSAGPSTLGLDIGTSRIVLARPQGDQFEYTSQLNAFVSVPYSAMTESSLRREGVAFAREGAELIVHGNDAPRFADLMSVDARRPMTAGVLNPGEPGAVPVVRQIVESLVPPLADKGRAKVCFSIPAAPLDGEQGLTYHEATVRQMLAKLGYQVESINEGLAVVFSELEDTNYTGIGISCGGGLCNVAFAYLAMPIVSFSIPKAGDFIDCSTAAVTGDLATRVRMVKEATFHFNGNFTDQLQQVLAVYYDDMIQALINAMKDAFSAAKRMPKITRPVPIVLSGGTALPAGFRERFERQIQNAELAVPISEVRLARDPLTATARGALVAALAES